MKKIILLAVVVLVFSAADAQDYKKFKVGIGLGYGVPNEGSGGVLLYLEPMYRITDQIAAGLRIESAAFLGKPISGTPYTTSAFGVGSYTLNGQYYFSNNTFRPFVGAGFGMFTLAAASADIGGSNVNLNAAATVFGFYPRIGFDLGHFNLSIDYNVIPSQETTVSIGGFGTTTTTSNYSYIGFRIGGSIGGGKK
ncbi:MAG: hypothetical protein JNN04_12390 [Cyclobacteriaceae bacterium]|nr:hypothetical protein [Cyclobacteriaceae bacterium]